jgi:hypothetical protein
MNIADLAVFYVDVIEPVLKFCAFLVIAIFLLYLLNMLRDAKKKTDLINGAFNFIIKLATKTVSVSGRIVVWTVKVLLNIIRVIFASIRDFFTSKI